jgi:proteasome accessory factor C
MGDTERRNSASTRLRRLLAMVPWLAANDGPKVADVCARFGITETELQRDLGLLSTYVGVPPYTPEALFDITIQRGRVFAHMTPALDRPLRLSPEEAVALVVAGRALADVPGADPKGPLARGLDKVADVLGVDGTEAIEVDLGTGSAPTLATLREAVASRHRVEIDHFVASRDERVTRVVDPWAVQHDAGAWYLVGHDHLRGEPRSFRVDRILGARVLPDRASRPPRGPLPVGFAAGDDDPRVVLELAEAGRWVVETYPVETVEVLDDGRVRATLAVAARSWLERLLLRLGPAVRVVDGPPELRRAGAEAAERVLARYRR